jgi:hypothetical protein
MTAQMTALVDGIANEIAGIFDRLAELAET